MKKQHLSIVAAAALAVGGMGWSTARAADDAAAPATDKPTAGQSLENAASKTGDAIKSGAEKAGDAIKSGAEKTGDALHLNRNAGADQTKNEAAIRDVLAQVAQASATKGGLNDIAERFVDADRNRLGQNQDALKNNPTLDGRIAEFQKDWKAKYNQDFNIKDENKVFDASFAMIMSGEQAGARTATDKVDVSTPGGTASGSTAGGTTASGSTASGTASGTASDTTAGGTVGVHTDGTTAGVDAPKANTDGNTAADRNLNDKGRNVATVTIAASHDMPAVTVPMIHEAGGWKLDIPDSVDSTKLRDGVLNALTKADEMKDKWPEDVNDAYRAVTHSVLLAIYPAASDSAQPAAGQLPADSTITQPQSGATGAAGAGAAGATGTDTTGTGATGTGAAGTGTSGAAGTGGTGTGAAQQSQPSQPAAPAPQQ